MNNNQDDVNSIRPCMGWREYLALPDLGIDRIKAKIDTGARSSALHAFDIESFQLSGQEMIRFKVHPEQNNSTRTIEAERAVIEYRQVRNSGGQAELRPVILIRVKICDYFWPIELTLTNRETMGFRMLLGRAAVRRRFFVDPGRSYLLTAD